MMFTGIEVDGKAGPIHRCDQREIAVGAVGYDPGHRFNRELGAFRFDRIQDVPDVLHRDVETHRVEVVRMRAIPRVRSAKPRDVDGAQRPDFIGQRELLAHRVEGRLSLAGIVSHHVEPEGAHLGDDHVFRLARRFDRADSRRVLEIDLRTQHRPIAQLARGSRQLDGVWRGSASPGARQRPTQPDTPCPRRRRAALQWTGGGRKRRSSGQHPHGFPAGIALA
jgi:hypothetical protein